MAQMHPEEIEALEKPTPGDKRSSDFFASCSRSVPLLRSGSRFLREAARPDSEIIGWYESAIGEQGREKDFILLVNEQGLLILEVKDWLADQIGEADSCRFKIFLNRPFPAVT